MHVFNDLNHFYLTNYATSLVGREEVIPSFRDKFQEKLTLPHNSIEKDGEDLPKITDRV